MFAFEQKILDFIKRYALIIGGVILLVLSVVLRIKLFPYLYGDIRSDLLIWFDKIKLYGGFDALGHKIGNYNMLYQTLMAAITYIKADPANLIKAMSCVFDYILAFGAGMLVYRAVSGKRGMILGGTAFFVVLFTPTVFINSALWGQCDAMYSSFLIISFLLFYRKKHFWGFFAFGIAFAFKLQALFFFPALLLYYIAEHPCLLYKALGTPAAVLLCSTPCLIKGRPLSAIWSIYLDQVGNYRMLTLDYPNIYCWLPDKQYDILQPASIVFALCVVAMLFIYLVSLDRRFSVRDYMLITVLSGYTCVMFLPEMHDRYAFPVEILMLVFTIVYHEMYAETVALQLIALFSYFPFILDFQVFDLKYVAVANLIVYSSILYKTIFAGKLSMDNQRNVRAKVSARK